jgi:HSP20 family protein
MLTRWNPFSEMISIREAMDRLFDESFVRPSSLWGSGMGFSIPFDVYEAGDDIYVRAAVPGADPGALELTVNQGVLTIKGNRAPYTEQEQQQQYTWHHRGLPQGTFQFAVSLPTAVYADQAEAHYDAGIVTVRLPKVEAARSKRIAITVGTPQQALPAGAR